MLFILNSAGVPSIAKFVQLGPLQVAIPTFSPSGGTYGPTQSVTIVDATAGAQIYYTTDGSTPTAASTPYTGPISVSTTTTVKAVAMLSGWTRSSVASAVYTIASGTTPGSTSGVSVDTWRDAESCDAGHHRLGALGAHDRGQLRPQGRGHPTDQQRRGRGNRHADAVH